MIGRGLKQHYFISVPLYELQNIDIKESHHHFLLLSHQIFWYVTVII